MSGRQRQRSAIIVRAIMAGAAHLAVGVHVGRARADDDGRFAVRAQVITRAFAAAFARL